MLRSSRKVSASCSPWNPFAHGMRPLHQPWSAIVRRRLRVGCPNVLESGIRWRVTLPASPMQGVLVRFAKCGQCGRPLISSAPAGVRSLGLASSSPGIKWWSGSSCGGGWRESGCGLPGSPAIPVAPCLPALPFASGRVRQVAAIRAHRIANHCRVCGGPDRSGNGDTRPRG